MYKSVIVYIECFKTHCVACWICFIPYKIFTEQILKPAFYMSMFASAITQFTPGTNVSWVIWSQIVNAPKTHWGRCETLSLRPYSEVAWDIYGLILSACYAACPLSAYYYIIGSLSLMMCNWYFNVICNGYLKGYINL